MATVGVRELRDKLSHYLREVERTGEPITVTDHGRPIAELVPVAAPPKSRIEQLIEAGVLRPPRNSSPRPFRIPATGIRLPPGTVQQLIDEDREEREWGIRRDSSPDTEQSPRNDDPDAR